MEVNKEVLSLRNSLEETGELVQKMQDEYEQNLRQFYSLKSQEWILEHHLESWKLLFRELETNLATKQEDAHNGRVQIWKDREDYCACSTRFVKEFSIETTLVALKRANQPRDDNVGQVNSHHSRAVTQTCNHMPRIAKIDKEIGKLRHKEAELNRMEQDLAPDEETIQLLQEAVGNSARNLEELEAEIKALEGAGQNDDIKVRSILKRPCFVQPDTERKQVRFE
ncbi:uncharacterized protein LOC128746184 [Sabethes cyaneus]|uniref:uncharacterized protein LOC128746184 n=1 Tax=Sabethes cyaneus TaxID=53552 RepID=UPI00237D3888|nr:uncharacterized protein LOC128746184 [Sabethes cyaneus]